MQMKLISNLSRRSALGKFEGKRLRICFRNQDVTKSAGAGNTFVQEGRNASLSFKASTVPRQHVRRERTIPQHLYP